MTRGGARLGAGRPKKPEKTVPIRIPEKIRDEVLSLIASGGSKKLSLYVHSVSAGSPLPADDDMIDRVDLTDLLVQHPAETFLVRASGESMINAGIYDHDILVVDRSVKPASGSIVIAAVYGELTVKRLNQTQDGLYLMPENEIFKPIKVLDEHHMKIWGVVRHVIHAV